MPLLVWAMAPKFPLFTQGSKLPLNKGFKNMLELLQSCAQPSLCFCGEVRKIFSTYPSFLELWKKYSTHCRLPYTTYQRSPISILGTSSWDLDIPWGKSNFRYIQLWDLDIPWGKWLNYLRTVETLIRPCILRHLILVCILWQLPF